MQNFESFSGKPLHDVLDVYGKNPYFLHIFFSVASWLICDVVLKKCSEMFKASKSRAKNKNIGEGKGVLAHTSNTSCQNFMVDGPIMSSEIAFSCRKPDPLWRWI